jgi:SpoVK/Ycf46/Vps4 family AAA+-type ATPase
VSSAEVSRDESLPPAEAVLVDVLRMILRGRADDVPARMRKVVSTPDGRRRAKLSEPGRAAIALLLAEEPSRSGPERGLRATPTRRAAPSNVPADVALDVEAVTEAPAPVLDHDDQQALEDVVREYRERERLSASGLHPTRTVLLSGAPGTGKTMTIAYLAAQIGRPLMRIEPADVIGSFLGESARALSSTFERARDHGAALALDELDALAKRRDDVYDVGEFKRFVTTLLVELDRWPGHAPLIAATNHLELLDPALERRFELHVRLQPPGPEGRRAILEQAFDDIGVTTDAGTLDVLVAVMEGATGADLAGVVQRAARRAVLDGEPLDRALLTAALRGSAKALDRDTRARFAAAARDRAGLSTRQIGELMGCSHTAARRLAAAGAAAALTAAGAA